jgi:hypothetical protein
MGLSVDGSLMTIPAKNDTTTFCLGMDMRTNIEVTSRPQVTNDVSYLTCGISGQDVWMVQQASISYQGRGTTTASVVDVFGGSHNEYPFTDQTAYFYGTTLYLFQETKMNKIDPIPKQNLGTTGTFPTVWDPALPGYNIDYVHFIDANTFYAIVTNTPSTIYKCSIDSGGAVTVLYQTPVSEDKVGAVPSIHTNVVDEVVHIFVMISGDILHFVDDGTAILQEGDAWTIDATVLALSGPPLASCSDFVQNQDETDVDCGGATCSTCNVGKKCNQNSDCSTDLCMGGICGKCNTIVIGCNSEN